jgi:hypothetical protein
MAIGINWKDSSKKTARLAGGEGAVEKRKGKYGVLPEV